MHRITSRKTVQVVLTLVFEADATAEDGTSAAEHAAEQIDRFMQLWRSDPKVFGYNASISQMRTATAQEVFLAADQDHDTDEESEED